MRSTVSRSTPQLSAVVFHWSTWTNRKPAKTGLESTLMKMLRFQMEHTENWSILTHSKVQFPSLLHATCQSKCSDYKKSSNNSIIWKNRSLPIQQSLRHSMEKMIEQRILKCRLSRCQSWYKICILFSNDCVDKCGEFLVQNRILLPT